MKLLSNLLLCALILCTISSCQKDEVDLPITVEGKWEITAVSCQDGIQTIFKNGSTSGGAFIFQGKSFASEIEFKADATYQGSGTYTRIFSTLVNGEMRSESLEANDFAKEGVWEKIDSNLELTNFDVETIEILDLDAHRMSLKAEMNETIEETHRTINNVGMVYYTLRKK